MHRPQNQRPGRLKGPRSLRWKETLRAWTEGAGNFSWWPKRGGTAGSSSVAAKQQSWGKWSICRWFIKNCVFFHTYLCLLVGYPWIWAFFLTPTLSVRKQCFRQGTWLMIGCIGLPCFPIGFSFFGQAHLPTCFSGCSIRLPTFATSIMHFFR